MSLRSLRGKYKRIPVPYDIYQLGDADPNLPWESQPPLAYVEKAEGGNVTVIVNGRRRIMSVEEFPSARWRGNVLPGDMPRAR